MSGGRIVYKKGYGPMDGDDAVDHIEPPNYVEDGVGMIARGLYIIERDQGPRAASDETQRVLSFFRVEWLEQMKRLRAAHPEEFS